MLQLLPSKQLRSFVLSAAYKLLTVSFDHHHPSLLEQWSSVLGKICSIPAQEIFFFFFGLKIVLVAMIVEGRGTTSFQYIGPTDAANHPTVCRTAPPPPTQGIIQPQMTIMPGLKNFFRISPPLASFLLGFSALLLHQ